MKDVNNVNEARYITFCSHVLLNTKLERIGTKFLTVSFTLFSNFYQPILLSYHFYRSPSNLIRLANDRACLTSFNVHTAEINRKRMDQSHGNY